MTSEATAAPPPSGPNKPTTKKDHQHQHQQPQLTPLTLAEFTTYNRLSAQMDHFHNHFRRQWTLLWDAAVSGRRPQGMSIRQFLATGQQFLRQLEMHHGYEEAYFFPVLGERMPEFAEAAGKGKGKGKKGKGKGRGRGSKKGGNGNKEAVVAKEEGEEEEGGKVEIEETARNGAKGEAGGDHDADVDNNDEDSDAGNTATPSLWGAAHHIDQHRQIHVGMEGLSAYLDAVRSGETELEMAVLKTKMESWGTVLWEHLDQEVKTLAADNMRQYWTLEEMNRMPW